MARDYKVQVEIVGKDAISNQLAAVGNALKKLSKDVAKASGEAQKATSPMDKFKKSLGEVGRVALGMVAAQVFQKMAAGLKDLVGESFQAAARVEELGNVLNVIGGRAGYTEEQLTALVASVKAMGIETSVAQKTVIQFSRYQMDMAKSSELARVAQDAAVIAMQDSSQALDGLIHGITTFNPRVLRTYGIVVNMKDAFDRQAESLGKTASELSTTEKVQAALNAVLAEGSSIAGAYDAAMDSVGKQMRSLSRHTQEVKRIMGEGMLPVVGEMVGAFTDVLKAVEDAEDTIIRFGETGATALQKVAAAAGDIATGMTKVALAEMALANLTHTIDVLAGEAEEGKESAGGLAESWREAGEFADFARLKYEAALQTVDKLSAEFPELSDELEHAARASRELAEETKMVTKWGVSQMGVVINQRKAAKEFYDSLIRLEMATGAVASAEAASLKDHEATASALYAIADAAYDAAAAKEHLIRVGERAASLEAHRVRRTARTYYELKEQRKEILDEIAQMESKAGGARSDVNERIAQRERDLLQQRVDDYRMAQLEMRYWEEDQYEFIAGLNEELGAALAEEFKARTAAAKAEADEIAKYNTRLAADLLDAESDYQKEKARLTAAGDEEGLAALEAENAKRVTRLKERAALEQQIEEERWAREVEMMREAGRAGGAGFAEGMEPALDRLDRVNEHIATFQSTLRKPEPWMTVIEKAQETGKVIRDEFSGKPFEDAIRGATDLEEKLIAIGEAAREALTAFQTMQTAAGATGIGGAAEYQAGGVVPGAFGAPRMAVVHGGERILPATTNNYYNLTINSSAGTEPIAADFAMMQMMAA